MVSRVALYKKIEMLMLLIFRFFFCLFECIFTLTGVAPVEVGAVGDGAESAGAGRFPQVTGEPPIGKQTKRCIIHTRISISNILLPKIVTTASKWRILALNLQPRKLSFSFPSLITIWNYVITNCYKIKINNIINNKFMNRN